MALDTHLVRPWRRRMVARDLDEPHRAATPLELFFDLCFVVAVAQAASQLHHALAEGHWNGALMYLLVFSAIWWPWVNYTWFVSAYDTDDVPFRLLTLVQMAGVLVLSAGIPAFFEHLDNRVVIVAYVIMRLSLVLQWLRVAHEHRPDRRRAMTYVVGGASCQMLWLTTLLMTTQLKIAAFLVLLVLELLVPVVAERGRQDSWHPGHLAERFGLFTILVLGEVVLSTAVAFQVAATNAGISAALLVLAGGGLVVCFAMWWWYFDHDLAMLFRETSAGEALKFAYFAVVVFAAVGAVGAGLHVAVDSLVHQAHISAVGAVGAGLHVAVDSLVHQAHISAVGAALTVAVPVALYLVLGAIAYIWSTTTRDNVHPIAGYIGAVLLLTAALAANTLSVAGSVAVMGLIMTGVIACGIISDQRILRRQGSLDSRPPHPVRSADGQATPS